MKIYKEGKNLMVEIPLRQHVTSPYQDGDLGEMDNIIGIVCGNEMGFAQLIDMSYKNKDSQIGGMILSVFKEEKEFMSLCKDLGVGFYKYPTCEYCHKPIYGSFTIGDKGNMCWDCEYEKDEKEKLDECDSSKKVL